MPQTPARKMEIYRLKKAAGICTSCKLPAVSGFTRCARHAKDSRECCRRTSRPRSKAERKAYWDALQRDVISAYGGACKCCGETILMLLTMDHIHNDGKQHRAEVGSSHSMYLWLRRNKYPEGFQILCYSCNLGKFRNGGVCPHQTEAAKLFLVKGAA